VESILAVSSSLSISVYLYSCHFSSFSVLMTVVSTGNEIPMFGVAGRSVRLPCNIPIADRPIVEWSDMVWTSDGKPSLIFRSERNPEFEVHASHQNAINYVIDNDFALTIDGLDMDADPGQYTCRSVVTGGRVFERHYYLTVGGKNLFIQYLCTQKNRQSEEIFKVIIITIFIKLSFITRLNKKILHKKRVTEISKNNENKSKIKHSSLPACKYRLYYYIIIIHIVLYYYYLLLLLLLNCHL